MATLQDRINQLSPWNATGNTTGSKKVLNAPERMPTNDEQIENYRVIWSDDGGETYHPEIIQLVAKDGAWHFVNWPGFVDSTDKTIKTVLEAKVKEWWTANKITLGYQTRSDSTIISNDLNLGSVECTFLTADTPPKIETHTWYFLKVGTAWTIAKGHVQKMYDPVA